MSQGLPSPSHPNTDWVKSERPFPSPTSTPHSGASSPRAQYNESPYSASGSEGLTDFKQQQQSERQVIQRVLQRTQVKPSANGVVDLSGLRESGTLQGPKIRAPRGHQTHPSSSTVPTT
ncbi:hypothetical protein CgunFtcFv8_007212 [Champsocephalus gunnari]|uniref:Uncharacterized protein n=1 Tax=Champsocephalus gunnari TaxID=52237 RepID=A0AAN8CGK4_CHAGU|nr:hypothetical protein CgunFtcFv8_007212 [Champsocephalus gunnari]